jgi:outer membrane receptor for monomeric catechols
MAAKMLRTIAVVAVCFSTGAFAVAGELPHRAIKQGSTVSRSADTLPASRLASRSKKNAARSAVADRDPYADPAAPYKADRLAWPHSEPILNTPGQTTVLTRQVLDDMNATSLRDALRGTAGVTVGR